MAIVRKTTVETQTPLATSADKPYIMVFQILDFILYIIEGFLFLSFLLLLTGANQATGFVRFVNSLANIFMAPFRFIFPVVQSGEILIDWSILVAMVVYALLFTIIRRVLMVTYTADRT